MESRSDGMGKSRNWRTERRLRDDGENFFEVYTKIKLPSLWKQVKVARDLIWP